MFKQSAVKNQVVEIESILNIYSIEEMLRRDRILSGTPKVNEFPEGYPSCCDKPMVSISDQDWICLECGNVESHDIDDKVKK